MFSFYLVLVWFGLVWFDLFWFGLREEVSYASMAS